MTFAVIKTGGKQYIVEEGDVLSIEKLDHDGASVTFDQVLLVAGDGAPAIGCPLVTGATVQASVVADGKGAKKMVFRYKNKTRYHKKKGHRQPFTQVKIDKIAVK
ncbi:MAG TPA: 50S ribosomal protein L21 [Candidatus Paceibacterota bacterium]|nr:50S ribosomal protein L21 [Candidatus Paceibacterota bacterium]